MKHFYIFMFCVFFSAATIHAADLVLVGGPRNGDASRTAEEIAPLLSAGKTTVKYSPTYGDKESLARIADGSADLAVVDSLWAYEAALGISPFSQFPKKRFSALAVVGIYVEHFLLLDSTAVTSTISDLDGKILYIGPEGFPEREAARMVLDSSGIDSFLEVGQDWDYTTAAELIVDGTVDGALFSGVVPQEQVLNLASIMNNHVAFLEVPDEVVVKIRNQWPIWFPYTVPAGTYPNLTKPYNTIARPLILIAAQSLNKETVKELLKNLFLDKKRQVGLPPGVDESMSLTYNPIKLHPGAAEYFKEKGY